ncbi:MAG: hypothetical protein PHD70_08320 [Anaerostipes sp.]|nr:hypothetical protein [Anaerostipes sp.]
MNKINRFLLGYMIMITLLCAYMCYLAFYHNEGNEKLANQVQSTMMKEKKANQTKDKKKITYELAIKNKELVVINTKTKEVFEYTDLNEDHLPVEVKKMLNSKTLFYSAEDVYHFLESYSS